MQDAEATDAIRKALLSIGRRKSRGSSATEPWTDPPEADRLVKDIKNTPHAFVLACIADRQIHAKLAWRIPYDIKQRIGTFRFGDLAKLRLADWKRSFSHRLRDSRVAVSFQRAIALIGEKYSGDASRIWAGRPASAAIIRRLLEFDGIGPKIATMAANLLVRELQVPVADKYSIDISVDRQVRRVFTRLGLVADGCKPESIIYRARELSPRYPGLMDLAVWRLGREKCRPVAPLCTECELTGVCPKRL